MTYSVFTLLTLLVTAHLPVSQGYTGPNSPPPKKLLETVEPFFTFYCPAIYYKVPIIMGQVPTAPIQHNILQTHVKFQPVPNH